MCMLYNNNDLFLFSILKYTIKTTIKSNKVRIINLIPTQVKEYFNIEVHDDRRTYEFINYDVIDIFVNQPGVNKNHNSAQIIILCKFYTYVFLERTCDHST